MIIDSHFHIWDPSTREHGWLRGMPSLQRRFWFEEFKGASVGSGVEAGLLVQVLNDFDESLEFLAASSAEPGVAGVVAWVDLEGDVASQVAALQGGFGGDLLVGVRHLVQDEADPLYLERSKVVEGVRALGRLGLTYDLLVRSSQLEAAVRFARRLDGQPIVLDHGGKPPIGRGDVEGWADGVRGLAELSHVYCKVSGLVTEAGEGWREEDILHFMGLLLEWFGPDRVIFGSDWPVCSAVANYEQVVGLAEKAVAGLSSAEREAFFSLNARRFYGLDRVRKSV